LRHFRSRVTLLILLPREGGPERHDAAVPIDHVTIRVSDLETSLRFYDRAFSLLEFEGERYDSELGHEWEDFAISPTDADHPPAHGLHIGFAARSREQIDAWWAAMRDDGAPADGPPGPRPEYGPDYYGAFVRDPDGNSVEAVRHGTTRDDGWLIDHLWIRVRDLAASAAFYRAIAPPTGLRVKELPDRVQLVAGRETFSILEGPATEHLHLALGVPDQESVGAFHAAGLTAGGRDNGAPGERPVYHPGYYGAFLLDPDGNNVEAVFHDRQ
jgi:catechol 2,3-dioxygenase-like lactoylglutathione lyase family enzyme